MHAAVAASGDRLTTGEFSTIEHQVISAVEVSDYKKVRQGTYYTLVDGRIVRKYQSESGSVEYELVDTIPADRHKPKEPEKSWVEKATEGIVKAGLHVGLAGYKTGKAGLKLSKEALDFVVLDDVNTVLDSEASAGERIWAGASIIPAGKVLKLVKAGGVIKFANKGKQTAKKVKKIDNPISKRIKARVPNDEVISPTKRGNAPMSKKDNKPIEIHHKDQNPDGPFYEMHPSDHRYGKNDKINHPNKGNPSKIDRKQWRKDRRNYWKGEWDNGRWDN
ncbi:HNH/ENDO VII family nuclease [Virgibacillus pantothenticus]|nr:HNH/ENDO VII family nuclease [Virgibacillus pantothenticus]